MASVHFCIQFHCIYTVQWMSVSVLSRNETIKIELKKIKVIYLCMYLFYLFVIALSITGFPYNETFLLGKPGSTACPVIGPRWFHCLFTSTLLLSQGSSCLFGGLKGHFNTSRSWKLCYNILFIMFSFTLFVKSESSFQCCTSDDLIK